MKFTIIIPYFDKYDNFFDECINSVLFQEYENFECIIIACKYEMKTLLAHTKIRDKRVRVFESIGVDQSSKRNVGINESEGEYILFLDCDDILDRHFLIHSVNEINNHNPDLIVYGFTRDFSKIGKTTASSELIVGKENCRREVFSDYMLEKRNISKANFDSSCWKVFKKKIVFKENIRFQSGLKCAEDALFVRNYSIHIKSLAVNDSYCSYYWRINPKSTMNNIDSGFFDLEPFFISLENTLIELPAIYSSNLRAYLNSIICSRIDSALSFSRKGNYPLFQLIRKYKKSKYIRNIIQISFFKGRFYKIVALSIKLRLFFIFKPVFRKYIYKRQPF